MKLKLSFVGILYWLCATAFSFVIIVTVLHTIITLIPKKGNMYAGQSGPPVTMRLIIPDTTMSYSYSGQDASLGNLSGVKTSSHFNEEINRNLDYLKPIDNRQVNLMDSDFKKVFYFLKLEIDPFQKIINNNTSGVTVKIPMQIDTFINLRTQSKFYNFLFLVRPYLGLLLILLILYQLTNILNQLKLGINFNDQLFRRVKWIGWFIICSEIIKLILSIIYRSLYHGIRLISTSSQEHYYNPIRIELSSRLEFDMSFFFLGLLILVIAMIIQQGIQLQEESDLTV